MLAVLAAGLFGALAWAVVGIGIGYALHAAVQSAVDAAALDCASQAVVQRQVDARGQVYGESVEVPSIQGLRAAATAWAHNTPGLPLRLLALSVQADGPVCTVAVRVGVGVPVTLLSLRSGGWSATASAKAWPVGGSA